MKEYIKGLNKFLYINGLDTKKLGITFSSLKVPGGTKFDSNGKPMKFIGVILYMVKGDEVFIVVVPYNTERKGLPKKRYYGEDDWILFLRECLEETGIIPDYPNAWIAYERTAESDQDIPATFLACKISEGQLGKLRRDFNKYNPDDPDKGIPMIVPIHYAWKYLSNTHLIGVRGFMQKLLVKHLDEHISNVRQSFIKYCKGIIKKMEQEEQSRKDTKERQSRQE